MDRVTRIAKHLAPVEEQHIQPNPTSAVGPPSYNVAVLGAGGGIGQPLSLLMKINPLVKELRLYDVVNTAGVATDISHIASPAKVTAHTGAQQLPDALYGADLVLIPAGVPRKPGMTRDDLFNINAGIVKTLVEGVAKYCPSAWLGIISNPVNSTVPIAAEVLRAAGAFDPARVFGVTTLDVVRAEQFISEILNVDPRDVKLPVIGGHAGVTILPVLSAVQAPKPLRLPEAEAKILMERIQDAGTEVVKAKAGAGSATLSMAYAAARFAESCLKAMGGADGIVECAYVASAITDMPYFASPVRLGARGVEEFLPLPRLNDLEQQNFESMKGELMGSIKKGLEFAASKRAA